MDFERNEPTLVQQSDKPCHAICDAAGKISAQLGEKEFQVFLLFLMT